MTATATRVTAEAVSRREAAIARELARARAERRRAAIQGWGITAGVAIVMIAVWEVAATAWLMSKGVMAPPSVIVQSLIADASLYWGAFWTTAWVAIRGWFFGNLIAVVTAIVFVQSRALSALFLRLALVLYCLPLVAVNPILQLTFDPDLARVILAALAVYFTTLIGMMLGLRSVDAGAVTMVEAWGGAPSHVMKLVRMPSSVPALFTGLQIGAAAAALGAIFGEFLGAKAGMGVLLINGLMSLDLARVWSVALLVTLMAMVPYSIFGWLRRRLSPWSATITVAPAAGGGQPGPWWRRTLVVAAWLVGSLAVILVAWIAYLTVFDVSPFVGKTPADVYAHLVTDSEAAEHRSVILTALGVTLEHSVIGYIAGLILGVGAAMVFTLFPIVERVLTPLAVALRSIPIIVLTPVLILALGRGLWGVVAITAIVTFFPTLANTQTGLSRVPQDAHTIMRSYHASRTTTMWRMQLPYTLPAFFASARIAAPTAVLAATLAEWLATGDGLGHLIVTSRAHSDYTGLWAAAFVLTIVSVGLYSLVSAIERVVLRRYAPDHVS